MLKSKKLFWVGFLAIILAITLFGYYVFPYFTRNQIQVRAVSIDEQRQDYENFFNAFEDSILTIDEEGNSIRFEGTKLVDSSILEEDIGLEYSSFQAVPIRYNFYYCANTNDFVITVTARDSNGTEVIDYLVGVPFLTDEGVIDVGFEAEDEPIFLSELEDIEYIENCGWFSKLVKKVAVATAVIAVTAAVVAVAVVATPAVIAAATSVGTALSVSGGAVAVGATASAALTAASAAGAAAMATTTFAIAAATATIAACMSLTANVIDSYVDLDESFVSDLERDMATNGGNNGRNDIYYPCLRVTHGVALRVAIEPVTAEVAVAWIKLGGNMYTYYEHNAIEILTLAGFEAGRCEISPDQGMFYHYHAFLNGKEHRIAGDGRKAYGKAHSIHSFYGRSYNINRN